MLDVTAHGVNPSSSDCLPALQTLLASLLPSKQAILYFPQGTYRLGAPLDLSAFHYLRLTGDGACGGGVGTAISGNFPGTLIRYADPVQSSLKCDIDSIYFQNSGGSCLDIEGTLCSTVQRCRIDAGAVGLNSFSNFSFKVSDTGFYGPGAKAFPHSVGLQAWFANAVLENLDLIGWGEGARLSGMGGTVSSIRAEVNAIALRLGISYTGAKELLGRVVLQGLGLEANDTGILVASAQACVIQNSFISGTPNAPSGQSIVAIDDRGSSSECVYQQLSTGGSGFTQAAFVLEAPAVPTSVVTNEWRWCTAVNALGKPAWQVAPAAVPTTLFSESNYP